MSSKLRGVNHIGVPVRNLDETVAWYRDLFDIEPTFYIRGASGSDVEATVQVPGAVIDCAFFVIGNTSIEFLEYKQPPGRDFKLSNNDVGAVHICFEIEDLDEMVERLNSKGVALNATPVKIEDDSPFNGIRCAYFRDLQGIQLEFFQLPEGWTVD